jgi:hypothetical protein
MARVINGTLFVPSFVATGNPGEWEIDGATYANVADATGNGAFDLAVGFVLFVPAADPNTFLPVPGLCHRYVITALTVIDSSTIDATILWDENGPEVDVPNSGDTCIISEKGPGHGLAFPVSPLVYAGLAAGLDVSALGNDFRNIVDGITGGGGNEDKEMTEAHAALTTTTDGDFAVATGLLHDPEGAVIVTVNGMQVSVGDGTTSGVECYFTHPSNNTPRTMDAITVGDRLRWMGSFATYELAPGDTVQINYEYTP